MIKRAIRLLSVFVGFVPAAAIAAPGDPPAYQEVFEKAFVTNFSVMAPDVGVESDTPALQQVAFRTITIGNLIIKSGRICAADPFVALADRMPFTQSVPNGSFPVRLAVGDHPAGDLKDSRVAFARVDFSSSPVVSWRQAVIATQDLATLKESETFGYGVDAGTGSFYDPIVNAAVLALYEKNPDAWQDWQNEGEANGPKVIGPYSFVLMLPMGEANVAMFHSGWGDGFYTSWFGFDGQGNVAALLTDFNTIDWPSSKW